jgi:hypothetical protein
MKHIMKLQASPFGVIKSDRLMYSMPSLPNIKQKENEYVA